MKPSKMFVFLAALVVAGCAEIDRQMPGGDVFLKCEIKRIVNDEFSTRFVGQALVLRFEKGDKAAVFLRGVLDGSDGQGIKYEAAKSERGTLLGYVWESKSVRSSSELWVDTISGELYKLDRLNDEISEQLYADCAAVDKPLIS